MFYLLGDSKKNTISEYGIVFDSKVKFILIDIMRESMINKTSRFTYVNKIDNKIVTEKENFDNPQTIMFLWGNLSHKDIVDVSDVWHETDDFYKTTATSVAKYLSKMLDKVEVNALYQIYNFIKNDEKLKNISDDIASIHYLHDNYRDMFYLFNILNNYSIFKKINTFNELEFDTKQEFNSINEFARINTEVVKTLKLDIK